MINFIVLIEKWKDSDCMKRVEFTGEKTYSNISVCVNEKYGQTSDKVSDIIFQMASPYVEVEDKGNGIKIVNLSVADLDYIRSTEKYIKYLEETLDVLGVTVYRDVKGEIYLGSKEDKLSDE